MQHHAREPESYLPARISLGDELRTTYISKPHGTPVYLLNKEEKKSPEHVLHVERVASVVDEGAEGELVRLENHMRRKNIECINKNKISV